MYLLPVVIAAEHFQLARQVERVPEQHLIEDLAPDRADQPLDERMRNRGVGHQFYFLDVEHPQAGEPTAETIAAINRALGLEIDVKMAGYSLGGVESNMK